MFRSIFKKFLSSYVMISIISLLCISFITGILLQNSVYEIKKQALIDKAHKVNKLSNLLLKDNIKRNEYENYLQAIETTDNITIKLVTRDKSQNVANYRISDGDNTIPAKTINEVFSGKEDFIVNSDDDVMLGIPLRHKKDIIGGVFLYTTFKDTKKTIIEVYELLGITFLFTVIPTGIVIYFISRRFTNPLIQMSKVAERYSEGDFRNRVNYKNNDEIGVLAYSLNNMAIKLHELENARRDFIANISHELRTPLTTINANTQGIIDGVIEKDEEIKYLKVNLDETKRLTNLVNELIDMSSFDKGAIKLNLEGANLTEIIEQVSEQVKIEAARKKIEISINAEKGIIAKIDKDRIKQVLINILDNAMKNTYEEGKISISAKKIGDLGLIEIADTGCGIPKDKINLIFERFYKIRNDKGAGIGLHISKQIIEAHGGEIWVESEENKGTNILIKIPI